MMNNSKLFVLRTWLRARVLDVLGAFRLLNLVYIFSMVIALRKVVMLMLSEKC